MEERVRVSNAYFSEIERGERGITDLKIPRKLALAYGMSVTELVERQRGKPRRSLCTLKAPKPDVAFVSRGYEKFSREDKQHLTEFLQFLLHREQQKSEQKMIRGFSDYLGKNPALYGRALIQSLGVKSRP